MTTGVRQGCPLSPLLYAVCAKLLIERIRMELPSAVVRTYADDKAVLIQNVWTHAPTPAKIFADFGNMTNLHLNLSKTVIIFIFSTTKFGKGEEQARSHDTYLVNSAIRLPCTLLGLHTRPRGRRQKLERPHRQVLSTGADLVRPTNRASLHYDMLQRLRSTSSDIRRTTTYTTTTNYTN